MKLACLPLRRHSRLRGNDAVIRMYKVIGINLIIGISMIFQKFYQGIADHALKVLGGMLLVTACIFIPFAEWDLVVSRAVFDYSRMDFMMEHTALGDWFSKDIHVFTELVFTFFVIFFLFAKLIGSNFFNLSWARFTFVAGSIALSAGLVTNLIFKEYWGRARPVQLIEFGRDKLFSPAFLMSDQCVRNCSFFSGDAAMAFSVIAFALIAPRGIRLPAVLAAISFGCIISATRVLRGAHFLSDVLTAGIVTMGIIVACYRVLIWWENRPNT